jgi:hypothetical protein
LGALIGGFFGAEACLIVAAMGFLAQAAVILLSPVIQLAGTIGRPAAASSSRARPRGWFSSARTALLP